MIPPPLPVLTAIADPQREARVAAGIESGPGGLRLVRRCVDLADLLAAAAAGLAQVVVLSADLRQLDADTIGRLADLGVATVGLVSEGDRTAERRLQQLGVSRVVVDTSEPAEIEAALRDAVTDVDHDPALDRILEWSQPAPYPESPQHAAAITGSRGRVTTGQVVAVWGPVGAPGRTTIAVNLAAEIADLGRTAICVDADTYGGTVAQQLGVLDEAAGLAAACRQANNGVLDPVALAALAVEMRPRLRLLSGISRAERWPELSLSAVSAVLDCARSIADFIVVDCGFCLEQDEELAYDTAAPRRNGATRAALVGAQVVVGIAAGDPVGLARYVRARADLLEAIPESKPLTVVNRVRGGVVGSGDPRQEIAGALERYAGISPIATVPDDPAALDAAMANGQLLAEVAPKSPARLAIRELAVRLIDSPVSRPGFLARLRGGGQA